MRRRAGQYNRLITIRQRALVPDAAGGLEAATETTLCARRARIESGGGDEQQEKLQEHAVRKVLVFLPWDSTAAQAAPEMKILYGSRVLQIAAVEDLDDEHEELRITCEERVT